MSNDALQNLLTILLGGGFLTALVAWRRDRRQAPIERRTAVDASAKVASEIRTADIGGLRDIIASLREEVAALRHRVESAEERATAAEHRAEGAEIRAAQAESRATASELARRQDAEYIEHLIDTWPTPPPPSREHARRTARH